MNMVSIALKQNEQSGGYSMIYSKKEWLQIKEILNNRKQGEYPALDKKVKKEEITDATDKSQNSKLQKFEAPRA